MKSYAARTRPASASIRSSVDLLLGPVVIALALVLSALIPEPAWAQTAAPAVDYQFQRALSKIVAGSGSGLVVKQPGTMNIVNAGRVVGSFALNEKRLIDLATLAKYARASTVPAVLALAGTELLKYGLEKCADGTLCARHSTPPDQGGTGTVCQYSSGYPNGYPGTCKAGMSYQSWVLAYRPGATDFQPLDCRNDGGACRTNVYLQYRWNGAWYGDNLVMTTADAGALVPATSTDQENAWKYGFQTDPFLQERYWGFEDQTKNLQAWAEALAQTAEVINGTVTDVRPAEKTTTSAGTTTKQTTCTYTAAGTADKVNPVNVTERCTTTTTAPDGTQTQETTEKTGPQGADKVPPKVEVETCGLPGKPACKIDETGTPTEQAGKDKFTAVQTELTTARQAAEQQLRDAAQVSTFGLSIPTLLPGGSCQPIQFFKWKEFDGTVDLCERLGFIRTLLSWLWGTLAAIYIYHRVSSANA